MFPNSKKLRQKLAAQSMEVNTFSQKIPPEWNKPLVCEEEGFFQNPNDCHKFYRCFKGSVRGGFQRTLFECNPSNLVFDPTFKVCVAPDADGLNDVCGVLAGPEAGADY